MVLAVYGVALPVAYAVLLIHNLRTLVNTDSVLDCTSALLTTRVTFPARLLAAQVPTQVATTALICINVQVDRFMTDLQSALPEQAAETLVPDSCPVESIARLPSTPAMSDAVLWRNSFDARPVIPAPAWDANHVDPCSV